MTKDYNGKTKTSRSIFEIKQRFRFDILIKFLRGLYDYVIILLDQGTIGCMSCKKKKIC